MAREIADQLARYGKVERGRLGVTVEDHPAAAAAALQAEMLPGAMISDITPSSPAAKAGLKCGDVIVAINGKPVVSAAQMRTRVGLARVGETIEVEYLRSGSRGKIAVRIVAATP